MTDFPGYVEITCPFCGRYRHIREEALPSLQHRTEPEGSTQVACGDCWRLVTKFVKRARPEQVLGIPNTSTPGTRP